MLRQNNFVKFFFAVLVAMLVSINGYAYTMGPYLTAGGGASDIDVGNFFNNKSITLGGVNLGAGYLWPVFESEFPFFVGVQGNVNASFGASKTQVYGADISGIIGKDITSNFAVYSKLGIDSFVLDTEHRKTIFTGGPLVGVGVGYQVTPNLRFTTEANLSVIPFNPKLSLLVNLQYAFN